MLVEPLRMTVAIHGAGSVLLPAESGTPLGAEASFTVDVLGWSSTDVELIAQIASHAGAAGVPKDGFEVVMLYGIRAKEQQRLARAGYKVQVLIADGAAWYPWYMRRLAERPANVLFALRQMLPG